MSVSLPLTAIAPGAVAVQDLFVVVCAAAGVAPPLRYLRVVVQHAGIAVPQPPRDLRADTNITCI